MTNEYIDNARVEEAFRLFDMPGETRIIARIAAQLAREGWMPPPPVDPDVFVVREVLAAHYTTFGLYVKAADYRKGVCDNDIGFSDTLSAYRAALAGR